MNKMDIEVKVLINADNATIFAPKEPTIYDDIFRQPSIPGGKKYSNSILLVDAAQFKNKKLQKWNFKDTDNVNLESDARLVISIEDWEDITTIIGCKLKKGDLVTSVAGNDVNLIINEIRPTGFLNGSNTLFILNLSDNSKPMGGVL
jgi:hypothetical protein